MKKRIIWLVVSALMVLSLVLASCAPKVTEEEVVAKEEVVKEEAVKEEVKKEEVKKEEVAKEEGLLPYQQVVPRYGGTMNLVQVGDQGIFDQAGFRSCITFNVHQTNEALLTFDRTKGPAGTDEWDEGYPAVPMIGFLTGTGSLAESWERDWPNSFTFHIRKGVRFHDKPPANGREMTAEDVLFTLRRLWSDPDTYAYRTMGGLRDMKDVAGSIYLDPDDPGAVVVEANPALPYLAWEQATQLSYIVPKEQTTKVTRWQDAVGTGPFILTDYVSGSSYTFTRNPNYWGKDQVYPQNQLPYVDTLKIFIMPDWASQMAAMQTGKLERLDEVEREQAEILWRYNPALISRKYVGSSGQTVALSMRLDVKPFDDVRVRQAMMMAIDHEEILRDYLQGDGHLFYGPVSPNRAEAYMWVPLEEMPEVVQQMYGYYPDEAARLLDEAGYPGPKRFTTSVTAWNEERIEMASLVAAYWAKVGVTLNIDVKEQAVYQSMVRAKSFPSGSMESPGLIEPYKFCTSARGVSRNTAMIDREYIQEALSAMSINAMDLKEQARIMRPVMIKWQEEALLQILPFPNSYRFWQPWLTGYYGEQGGGYLQTNMFARYAWIDQDLKQQMTGRR